MESTVRGVAGEIASAAQLALGKMAGRPVALTGQKGVVEYIADHFPRHVLTQSPGAGQPDEREGA